MGETKTNRYLLNGSAEYDITNQLSAKVSLGYDYSDATATSAVSSDYNNNGRISGNGQASRNNLEFTSKLLEATLNYNKAYEDFSIDALVGFSFQDFRRKGFNSQGWGIGSTNLNGMISGLENTASSIINTITTPYQQFGFDVNESWLNSIIPFDDQGVLAGNFASPYTSFWYDTFDNTDELQSFFARANVTFKDKFLFTATFRADGSSRFGGNNQYGYFPSGAFAWKLNQEEFIPDAFTTLKLRISAGVAGNQSGLGYANYLRRARFQAPSVSDAGTVVRPARETVSNNNPDLKWETTTDYNIGLDFGLNNDRLRGAIDFYRKETRDLLIRRTAAAPAFDPFFVFLNLPDGVVLNQGIEFSIGYDFISTEDTSLSADFNIAYNKNEVTGLQGFEADFGALNGPGLTGAFAQRLTEGRSLFSYYMAEYSETNGVPDFQADNKVFAGKDGLPDVNAGLSLNFAKGRFDASAYFTGQFGFYVYNNTANAFLNRPTFETSRNGSLESISLLSQEVSTLYLEKGDFVRLQSLTIGYDFPISGDGYLDSFRLTLNGQNLFLITDYSGLDPEVASDTGDLGTGIPSASIDYTSFPRPRTITLGVHAKF